MRKTVLLYQIQTRCASLKIQNFLTRFDKFTGNTRVSDFDPETSTSQIDDIRKTIMKGEVNTKEDRKLRKETEHSEEDEEKKLADLYTELLRSVGENVEREGLRKTPQRAAKAMLFFTKGYNETVAGE